MKKGVWDIDMCKQMGLDIDMLPERIYKCHEIVGGVSEEAANATGLLQGTPVVLAHKLPE